MPELQQALRDALARGGATRGREAPGSGWRGRLADALDPGLYRPKLAPGGEMASFSTRWGTGYMMIRSPGKPSYSRLSDAEARLLALMDGEHTVRDLVVDSLRTGSTLDLDEVAELVTSLRASGFLTDPPTDVQQQLRTRLAAPSRRALERLWRLFRRQTVTVRRAERFTAGLYRRGGRHLFNPLVQVVLAGISVGGIVAFLHARRSVSFAFPAHDVVPSVVILIAFSTAAILLHEIGHALAIHHAGRRVLSAGFQLYMANLVFFIDSSDMLMASRRDRLRNAWYGPYMGMIVAGILSIAVALWPAAPSSQLLLRMAVLSYLNVLINLIPFLELDGYWIMTDLLDTPNLRPRSLAFLRHELPDRLRARRRLTSIEWGLVAFGVLGAAFTVLAFAAAWFFWRDIFGGLVRGLWRHGLWGRAALLALGLFVLAPVVHGLADVLRAIGRRGRGLGRALRFRAQTRWRREAAEMIAALPLLSPLSIDDLGDIAGRVELHEYGPGVDIVREGEAGRAVYLIRRGACSVLRSSPEGSEIVVGRLGPRQAFGELALLESKPRAASVRAEVRTQVFRVDKGTFDRLLARSMARTDFGDSLASLLEVWSLEPFRDLSMEEARGVARAGEWLNGAAGRTFIRQGDPGHHFYVVAQGQLEVLTDGRRTSMLTSGGFFGETALLLDVPRTATVRSLTPVRLFRVDRASFQRLVAASFRRGRLTSAHGARSVVGRR